MKTSALHLSIHPATFVPILFFALSSSLSAAKPAASSRVEFNRDILPILANSCFPCHGPDQETREADLRLDREQDAKSDRGGYAAIVPEAANKSELIRRVFSTDPDEVMPPPQFKEPLSKGQLAMLRQWIDQGAEWQTHWSFQPIQSPPLPLQLEARHPIDAFILDRLQTENLRPVPRADRITLARRVFLDLIGLLPTPEQIDEFVNDAKPGAFERLVDRLLASPHYGERWGRHWLDQARYADSDGYSIDGARVMWPYRDWVINALNQDMPFDQFTIEQIAGDQLDSPTSEQLVATGFHRNTLVNQEGGSDPEQFRNETVVDRVNTTGSVWLGLTVGCAQCHTHKFDPITQTEYYQLFAFFNSTEDKNSHAPKITPIPTHQRFIIENLNQSIQAAKQAIPADKTKREEFRDSINTAIERLEESKRRFEERFGSVMIMRELKEPRATHLHIRGDFLRPGEQVQSDVPSILPALPEQPTQYNRLDLARWLVDKSNPLTARVTVNRVWMRFFGIGLVETENDFGTQGATPTHPDLLDWLASWLIQDGWSLKRLHRLIVLSDAYQRVAHGPSSLQKTDPRNQLLTRQSRLRVDAEIVRDLALSASGMMTCAIGGPSVYPPQPDGVYAFTQRKLSWKDSQGPDRYRRGIYTFFYRSAPHPMLSTFDAPNFQTVCTRRVRSNTPLQSLTMANDVAILELAEGLAKRILQEPHADVQQRITKTFRVCLGRRPDAAELEQLEAFLLQQLSSFADTPDTDKHFATDEAKLPAEQLAAWTALTRVLINLDEFVTRN
ncbi:MAG: DUF1549 domain-containing protein [Planctomycetaceae bacterium]|nr:DUF1549 domain-containing protein [Planctomycetaceae bacterium]